MRSADIEHAEDHGSLNPTVRSEGHRGWSTHPGMACSRNRLTVNCKGRYTGRHDPTTNE